MEETQTKYNAVRICCSDSKKFIPRSAQEYRKVSALNFYPKRLVKTFEPIYVKGQKRMVKLFGIIPLFSKPVKEDIYIGKNGKECTFSQIVMQYLSYDSFFDGKSLYKKAYVRAESKAGGVLSELNFYHQSDEYAYDFFNFTKDQCREYGNQLK